VDNHASGPMPESIEQSPGKRMFMRESGFRGQTLPGQTELVRAVTHIPPETGPAKPFGRSADSSTCFSATQVFPVALAVYGDAVGVPQRIGVLFASTVRAMM
jgi:hypothetical protein